MKYGVLKSLLGKFICKNQRVVYCHVGKVIYMENNRAIAAVVVKTPDGERLHRFVETAWTTDHHGTHQIIHSETLEEEKLDADRYPT